MVAAIIVVVLLALGGQAVASPPTLVVPRFVQYEQARAEMTWRLILGDGTEEEMVGQFEAHLPDGFVFVYEDDEQQVRRVVSHQGITAIHSQGRAEYSYELYPAFSVYSEVFQPLAYLLDLPGTLHEEEDFGGRSVVRFRTDTDPAIVYWLDKESGVPLRVVREEGSEYLTTTSYRLQADEQETLWFIGFTINANGWDGLLTLVRQDGFWFPQEIEVGDQDTQVIAHFSHWEVLDERADFRTLELLATSLQEGQIAYEAGEWEDVLHHFRQVMRIDPFYIPGYFYLAYSYGILGNYLGAVENYQQWLMLQPGSPLAMNNLAYTYMLQEVYLDEALELARQAVAIDPQPAYLDTLGYGYYLLGDYDQALENLEAALEGIEWSMLPEVYEHLILVHQALGNADMANYYQTLLDAIEEDLEQ